MIMRYKYIYESKFLIYIRRYYLIFSIKSQKKCCLFVVQVIQFFCGSIG